MFGCADTEQGQAACQHRPGGLGEGEPGAVGGRGFLVPYGEHRDVEGQKGIGDHDELPGDPVPRAEGRGGGAGGVLVSGPEGAGPDRGFDGRGVVGEGGDQSGGLGVPLAGRVVLASVRGPEAEITRVAEQGAAAGPGVLHPEQRIALAPHQQLVASAAEEGAPAVGIEARVIGVGGRGGDVGDVGGRARPPGAGSRAGSRVRSGLPRAGPPVPGRPIPYRAPSASTVRTTVPELSGTSVKFRKPGPVISTRSIPRVPAIRCRRASATARGAIPAGPASWSAALVA